MEENSGIFGRAIAVTEDLPTYEDLKAEDREERRAEPVDEDTRRQQLRDSIIANAISNDPLRPRYFVRDPGL